MDCTTCEDGRYRCPRDDGRPGCGYVTEAESAAQREAYDPDEYPSDAAW
ncbi:hypothetical protein ACFVVA_36920 [Kitasatospora sp. NPDC058048]